jgi:hypothetical protein
MLRHLVQGFMRLFKRGGEVPVLKVVPKAPDVAEIPSEMPSLDDTQLMKVIDINNQVRQKIAACRDVLEMRIKEEEKEVRVTKK